MNPNPQDGLGANPVSPAVAEAMRSAASEPSAPLPSPPAPAAPSNVVAAPANPHLEQAIVDVIKTIYDPEIPVNIFEIGLIYNIDVEPDGLAKIKMTLTSPGCPSAQEIPAAVKDRVEAVAGISRCDVEVVWDPVWTPAMMSEAARLQLGFF